MKFRETLAKLGRGTKIGLGIITILTVGFMAFWETQKAGFHEDEAYTISSSVSPVWDELMATADENGAPKFRSREAYESYASFTGFNPAMVYDNQARDVHPPLYYLIFHVLAGIFQGWTYQVGFIINLVFFLMTGWMVVKICLLLGKEKAILPSLILLNFSVLGINMVTFQRMYTVMGFFVALTLYYNLKIVQAEYKISRQNAIGLGMAILLGFLTQYFYVIYLAAIFLMMVVKMVKGKRYDSLKKYIALHVGTGIFGVILYPASLMHIFASYRGVGALVVPTMGLGERLWGFLEVVRANIYIPFLLVVALMIWLWGKEKGEERTELGLLVFPAMFYVVIVMLLAPYVEIRYLMPVMVCLVMGLAVLAIREIGQKVALGGAVVLVLFGAMMSKPSFLYSDYQQALDVAMENQDKTLVYVTDNNFTFIKNLEEFGIYAQTAIAKTGYNEIQKLPEIEGEFILRMDSWLDKGFVVGVFEGLGYEKKKEIEMGDYIGYIMEKK